MSDGSLMGLSGGASGGFLIFWKPDAEKDFFRFQLPSLARDMDVHPDGLQVASASQNNIKRVHYLDIEGFPDGFSPQTQECFHDANDVPSLFVDIFQLRYLRATSLSGQ
ncbi:MAG: hypothetical protein R3C05_26735 [Pirellulaceae bacterium]